MNKNEKAPPEGCEEALSSTARRISGLIRACDELSPTSTAKHLPFKHMKNRM
jgi:hypothetical protein